MLYVYLLIPLNTAPLDARGASAGNKYSINLLLIVVPIIPIQVPMMDPRIDQYLVFSA